MARPADGVVAEAAAHWQPHADITPLGEGHIHDTYLLCGAERTELVLQRVNDFVFTDPERLMAQTERVLACWGRQRDYDCPLLIPSRDKTMLVRLPSGYWRAWRRLPGITIDPARTTQQAYAAGVAFARLQVQLASLPLPRLRKSIEHFLELDYYLDQFDRVAQAADPELVALITAHRSLVGALADAPTADGYIHADCKINNLLYDTSGTEVLAILDFDTVMPGHRALDFGDLVRSLAASRGHFDADMFAACLRGFHAGGVGLTPREALAAPSYVTLMLAVRFLTDHLVGDRYFKVAYAGENLQRARAQLELLSEFDAQREMLVSVAAQVCAAGGN